MARALDLAAVDEGGLIAEDVIPRLFDLTQVDRPFIDSIGRTTADNYKKEFTDKTLAAPKADNTMYENEDLSAKDDSKHGSRYYNLCQQQGKVIKTSQRGRDVKLTYDADEFLQQLMDAGEELRMDQEAAAVDRSPAVEEVAGTSGARMAGAAAWCIYPTSTNGSGLSTSGAAGALPTMSTVGPPLAGAPTTAYTKGTIRGLTEAMVRGVLKAGWEDGAKFNLLMSTGDMIENIATYMFSSTARVATMQTDVVQSNRTGATAGNGSRQGGVVAQGAVNMFVGNFGTVTLTPNRQMTADTDAVDVLFIDTRYPQMAYLHDYGTKKLSETGLYDQEVLFVDSTMVPGATRSIAGLLAIDPTAAMVP